MSYLGKKARYMGVYARTGTGINHKGDVCYYVTYKKDGKKKWEKVGWESEGYSAKLADGIRSERMRSMRHGLELPKDKPKTTFKSVADKYVKWAKENRTKEGRDDRQIIEKHLSPRFDNLRMDQITSFDLERMKSEMLKAGYAPATAKHALVVVRQIYNKAIVWKLHKGENPIKGVTMPKLKNRRDRFLTREDADILLDALKVKSQQVHDMALLSLHSGMRFGEIANLRVHDIDMKNSLISITDPKNEQPRKVFMTVAVKDMLSTRIPENAKSNDLIFPDEMGKKMVTVSRTFDRVVTALGLNKGVTDTRKKVVFHTLRHSFASWLALQSVSMHTISELLGHQSMEMTRRYSHLSPDHRKAAIGLIEQKNNVVELVRAKS